MDNTIGQRIKNRRKELKITQTQIQEQTSVTSGNLSCIENSKYLPSAIALMELSRVLDCSIDWILTGDSKKSKNLSDHKYSDDDKTLLKHFHCMSAEDQEELLMIAQIKANKRKKENETSSHFKSSSSNSETA